MKVATALLDAGFDLNLYPQALHDAIKYNLNKMIPSLIELVQIEDERSRTALDHAICLNNLDACRQLAPLVKNNFSEGLSTLDRAVLSTPEILETLLEAGFNPSHGVLGAF